MSISIKEIVSNKKYLLDVRVCQKGRKLRKRETFNGTKLKASERYFQIRANLKDNLSVLNSSLIAPVNLQSKTFLDLIKLYESHNGVQNKKAQFIAQRVRSDIGGILIEELDLRMPVYFQNLRSEISMTTGKKYSNSTVNRYYAYINVVCNHAKKYEILNKNPLRFIDKLKETPRDRILSKEEKEKLFEVLSSNKKFSHIYPAVKFAYQVPIRKSELVNLTKDCLELDNRCIRLKNGTTKNGKGTYIPIPPNLLDYFKSIPYDCEYLFFRKEGSEYFPLGDFKKTWKSALSLAEIDNYRFHDLRHDAASTLINNGVPDRIVMSIANWKTDMLSRYYHISSKRNLDKVVFS